MTATTAIATKQVSATGLTPPSAPGEWSLAQIEAALSRRLPQSMLESKTIKGSKIDFIAWHTACDVLTKYAPGWGWEVLSITVAGDNLVLVGRLSIPTADGLISRDATGIESLSTSSYGDPSSNAESMALRRCAAKFGLCRYLYK